jgi:hypothetical protein
MHIPRLRSFVARIGSKPHNQQPQGCLGKHIGSINLIYHCWVATGIYREQFYEQLNNEILRHLDGWAESLTAEDFVVTALYMIGRSEETTCPTVCFISANPQLRKEARKVIKESGILLKYPDYKTAHMAKDPACGEELEELASQPGRGGEVLPASNVWYRRSEWIDSIGMPVYVRHASGLRTATGSAVLILGRLFYLVPAHVFFMEEGIVETCAVESSTLAMTADKDFEIDSDDDETGDGSADTDGLGVPERSLDTTSRGVPGYRTTFLHAALQRSTDLLKGTASYFKRAMSLNSKSPAKAAINTHSLVLLGTVIHWSIDQDWALVEILKTLAPQPLATPFQHVTAITESSVSSVMSRHTKIFTQTASQGRVNGTLGDTPSYIRVKRGKVFQLAYTLRLEKPLASGDCGSTLFDTASGKLIGHIVAGCPGTGFGYVLAAKQVRPELEKAVRELSGPILDSISPFASVSVPSSRGEATHHRLTMSPTSASIPDSQPPRQRRTRESTRQSTLSRYSRLVTSRGLDDSTVSVADMRTATVPNIFLSSLFSSASVSPQAERPTIELVEIVLPDEEVSDSDSSLWRRNS